MRQFKLFIFLFLLQHLLLSNAFAGMGVYVDHGSVKIRQKGDPIGNRKNLFIECAKNEFEPFQIFIFADQKNLSNVDVSVSVFTDDKGNIIDNIYIYKEHYLNVTKASRGDFQTGLWPDALLPKVDRYYKETRNAFPFSVRKGMVQGVWVDVGTTLKTPAGKYKATYTVTADGRPKVRGTIILTVWDFAIPSTSTIPNLWTIETSLLDNGHGIPANTPYRDLMFWLADMKRLYIKALLYHHMGCSGSDGGVFWTPCNKNGEVTSWKYWMISFKEALDGTAISSGPYAGAKMRATDIHLQRSADTDQKRFRTYLQQWWDKWKAEGWDPMKSLFLWALDEPKGTVVSYRGGEVTDYEMILTKAADMNSVDTGGEGIWRNTFTTEQRKPELANPRNGYVSLDISGFYCPVVQLYEYRPPWHSPKYKVARSSYPGYNDWATKKHWSYFACQNNACNDTGGPAYYGQMDIVLDSPSICTRVINWVFWRYRVNGTLYYMTNAAYAGKPYQNLWSYGGNGNGMLFYPGVPTREGRSLPKSTFAIGGTHDIPIESIRMKLIRETMEDLEYMVLLRDMGYEKFVDSQVNTIFTSLATPPGPYYQLSEDINRLVAARRNMARKISEVGLNDPVAPYEAPNNLRIVQ